MRRVAAIALLACCPVFVAADDTPQPGIRFTQIGGWSRLDAVVYRAQFNSNRWSFLVSTEALWSKLRVSMFKRIGSCIRASRDLWQLPTRGRSIGCATSC